MKHFSIWVCSEIEIWPSGRLPNVKTIEKLKSSALIVIAVAYEFTSLRILVFEKVLVKEKWSLRRGSR